MIKAIIFDFAGVIGAEGYWIWLKVHVPNLEEHKKYFLEISKKADAGTLSEEEFLTAIASKSGKPILSIKQEIFKNFTINKELLALIVNLKKKYKIGLLTNFLESWILEIIEKNNLRIYFDDIIISAEHKIVKPQPEIFHLALKRLGVAPKEAVFIDDRQENIDGASAVGMHAVLYTTMDAFLFSLKSLNI